jgi:lysozyme family protein
MTSLTPELTAEYKKHWTSMKIESLNGAAHAAYKVLSGKSRYMEVSKRSGVPWVVIGVIHLLEADCSFDCHLHNGDPLGQKTVNVPEGRPSGRMPCTWENSAFDALQFDHLDEVSHWTIDRVAYELECFNGWGYRKHDVPSPYLWAGSDVYTSGKFVADHVFDDSAVSDQIGGMVVLKQIALAGV